MPIRNHRPLPIDELAQAVPVALRRHGRLIVQAPTGSGKSTRVPSFLRDSGICGDGEIVVIGGAALAVIGIGIRLTKDVDVLGLRQAPAHPGGPGLGRRSRGS
jgi:ATP-dependent helicase HrpB